MLYLLDTNVVSMLDRRRHVHAPAPIAWLERLGEQSHRQPIGLADLIIAATAARHGLVLLTRNMSELGRLGIAVRDPFEELPAGT